MLYQAFEDLKSRFDQLYQDWFKKLSEKDRETYSSSVLQDGRKKRCGRPKGAQNKKRKIETESAKNKEVQVPADLGNFFTIVSHRRLNLFFRRSILSKREKLN